MQIFFLCSCSFNPDGKRVFGCGRFGAFTTSGILTSWKFGCPFCCWLITCGEYFMHNALTLWALFISFRFIVASGFRFLCAALHFIVVLSCVWGIECVCPAAQDYGPRQFIKPSSCWAGQKASFSARRMDILWPSGVGSSSSRVDVQAELQVARIWRLFPKWKLTW